MININRKKGLGNGIAPSIVIIFAIIIILAVVFSLKFTIHKIRNEKCNETFIGTVKDFQISAGGFGASSVATVKIADNETITVYQGLPYLATGAIIKLREGCTWKNDGLFVKGGD